MRHMSSFPLHFHPHEYEVAAGQRLLAARPFAQLIIPNSQIQPICFVDTGAPFSNVSHSIARICSWQRLSVSDPVPVFVNGVLNRTAPASELLTWNGIPCDLGEIGANLMDVKSGAQSNALRIVGKFAQRSVPMFHDRFVILGLSFFCDNLARLTLAGVPWNISGSIDLP